MVDFRVAIDGPAGSGKSSISKIVAKKLGFVHIDTGAMYRAVTIEALKRGIDVDDSSNFDFIHAISVVYENNKILLNGIDVSKEVRSDAVTKNVSAVSKHQCVRERMVHFQRLSAEHGKILMDGRDIGTVVLPNAEVKIFLTASSEERAKRRLLELKKTGSTLTFEEVLKDLERRDYLDSNREIAPLKKAEDALVIDTTKMNISEVCRNIINIVRERLNKMENIEMKDVVLNSVRVKDIVTGIVEKVENEKVLVNIGNFTEGTIYLDHYTTDKSITSFDGIVKEGDEITCEVTKVDEEHSIILLSRLNIIKAEIFKELVEDPTQILNVKVIKKVNKGYNVSGKGFVFFLPNSHAPLNVKNGQTFKVQILELNEARKSGVVSRRVVEKQEYETARQTELDSITVGDVLSGEVTRVEVFGAFVKFQTVQGLLRLNQISHTFIKDIHEAIHVGDKVEVKVVSKDNGKLLLSKKALLKTPFVSYAEEHKVSDSVKATVVNKMPYGMILEVAPHVRGLLHNSEYSWNPNDNFNSFCKIGDEVEVAIIGMDNEKERISFSRKALMDNPWSKVEARVGDLVDVTITMIDSKGLTVTALGVDGIIAVKDAFADGQTGKLDENYAVGDVIPAVITALNTKEWILELSVRKHLARLERNEFEKYIDSEGDQEVGVNLGELYKELLNK